MNTSAKFADALCCRLHRLEAGAPAAPGNNWPAMVPVAPAAADSWDSALSNSPDDAWWSGGVDHCGVAVGHRAQVGEVPDAGSNSASLLTTLPVDEGFLEEASWPSFKAEYRGGEEAEMDSAEDNFDDLESVSSDGSEILQMVNELLLAFNMEVAEAAEASAKSTADSAVDWTVASNHLTAGLLLKAAEVEIEDEDEEALSDHDFSDLPLSDDQEVTEDFGEEADNEASSSCLSSTTSSPSVVETFADVNCQQQPKAAPTSAYLATGLFRMPQEAVLEAMDYWGPLDRIRWLLWRSEPTPPQPRQHQQPQVQHPHHQQPRDKSKRACSFLLKGRCRKEDCEFAHDLGRVTCKFWAAGQCFKGSGCPFLHGHAA